MQESFKELVKRAKKGDTQAFAQLYSAIYKDLYRYAYYTLRSEQDAEDAVADAVTDCYAGIGRLKNEEAFKRWMFTVLSSKCKRIIKRYYKDALSETDEETFASADFEEHTDLKLALGTLDGESRMIVSLNVFGGYNSDEIAGILKLNRNTVRTKYSRALEKLRLLLTANEPNTPKLEKAGSGNE